MVFVSRVCSLLQSLATPLLMIALTTACCGPKKAEVLPSEDYKQLVRAELSSFLDLRIDPRILSLLQEPNASWRRSENLEDVAKFFDTLGDNRLWDFRALIARLKTSELFNAVRDEQILGVVLQVLADYTPPEYVTGE